MGRGKNKKRMGLKMLIPNIEYIEGKLSEFYAEEGVRVYRNLYKVIGNKNMCIILDIQDTEDEYIILKSFIKKSMVACSFQLKMNTGN
jgi:hypothetical protein